MTAPRYVPIHEAIVTDQTMAAALFQSYSRLLACAWRQNYQRTDPLDFETQIVPLLGLSRTQAREHLRLLRFGKFIQWTTNGAGRYLISFPNTVRAASDGGTPVRDGIHTHTDTTPSATVDDAPAASPEIRKTGKPESIERESGFPDSVVGVLNQDLDHLLVNTPTPSGIPENRSRPDSGPPQNETRGIYLRAERILLRFSMWPEASAELARLIADWTPRREYGNEHLPDVRALLGWVRYVTIRAKEIRNPQALVRSNLRAGARPADEYLPPLLCRTTGLAEGACDCPACDLYLPDALDLLAEKVDHGPFRNAWNICEYCHRLDCRCDLETEDTPA